MAEPNRDGSATSGTLAVSGSFAFGRIFWTDDERSGLRGALSPF